MWHKIRHHVIRKLQDMVWFDVLPLWRYISMIVKVHYNAKIKKYFAVFITCGTWNTIVCKPFYHVDLFFICPRHRHHCRIRFMSMGNHILWKSMWGLSVVYKMMSLNILSTAWHTNNCLKYNFDAFNPWIIISCNAVWGVSVFCFFLQKDAFGIDIICFMKLGLNILCTIKCKVA